MSSNVVFSQHFLTRFERIMEEENKNKIVYEVWSILNEINKNPLKILQSDQSINISKDVQNPDPIYAIKVGDIRLICKYENGKVIFMTLFDMREKLSNMMSAALTDIEDNEINKKKTSTNEELCTV